MSYTLVAGPYVGEFGWELCAWNPRVRYTSRGARRTVVLAPAASAPLYEFADEFIAVEPAEGTSNYMHGEIAPLDPEHAVRVSRAALDPDALHVRPTPALLELELAAIADPHGRGGAQCEAAKEWRRLGTPTRVDRPADVVLALRPFKRLGPDLVNVRRAYPPEMAEELAGRLRGRGLRLAVIGGPENRAVRGALDLRGRPLLEQCNALASADVAVGPSSGTLHLAQLARCAVVTWYDANPAERESSRARYQSAWNPWRAPLRFLEGRPSPLDAAAAVLELVREVRSMRAARDPGGAASGAAR